MKLTLLLFFTASSMLFAQHPTLSYINTLETNVGNSIQVRTTTSELDSSGNLYVLGLIRGTVDVDPSANDFLLTATGSGVFGGDFFLAKYNPSGMLLWAFNIGGSGDMFPRALSIDPFNNVIVSGQFRGTVDFDPGIGVQNATGPIRTNGFIVKYSSGGAYMWKNLVFNGSTQINITDHITNNGSTLGAFGKSVVTGKFNDQLSFPDVNGQTVVLTTTTSNTFDGFIAELDINGNWLRVEQVAFANLNVEINSIDYDSSSNVLLGFTLNAGSNFYKTQIDRYPANWNESTVLSVSPASTGASFKLDKVAIDPTDGNAIYLTGNFKGRISSNGSTILSNSSSFIDGFLIKAKSNGILSWSKHIKNGLMGAHGFLPSALSVKNKRIFLSAAFRGTYDILNLNGQHQYVTNNGTRLNACVMKYRSDGTVIWDAILHSIADTKVFAINLTGDSFYLFGSFDSVTDFDTDPTQQSNTGVANNTRDYFIGKYLDYPGLNPIVPSSSFDTARTALSSQNLKVLSLYDKVYTIIYKGESNFGALSYRVLNGFGQEVERGDMMQEVKGYRAETNLSNLASGVYVVELYSARTKISQKFFVK